jgi:hypothetical protein
MGVHLGAGQEPKFLQLMRIEEVCLINQQDDAAAAFVFLGGQPGSGPGRSARP